MSKISLIILAIYLISINLIYCQVTFTSWTSIGTGVFYRKANNAIQNNNVFITYSGYLATDVQSKTWSDRLITKSLFNNNNFYKMNHHYCVIGPKDVLYNSLEIQNSKLIEHLFNQYSNPNTQLNLIVVVAHSSGSYVADEFFQQFFNRINQALQSSDPNVVAVGRKLQQKIVYYNLDGAITPKRKDVDFLNKVFSRIYFVWASKKFGELGIESMNANSMKTGATSYPNNFSYGINVNANKDSCINSRCLHDVLITEIPRDVSNFNVAIDYTSFSANNEVQSDYFVQTNSLLSEMVNKPS